MRFSPIKPSVRGILILGVTLVSACGKNGEGASRGPQGGDATLPQVVTVGDKIKLSGSLIPGQDIPGDFERRLTSRYVLQVEQNTAMAIEKTSSVSHCETGGRVEGPFFDLETEEPTTTNPYRTDANIVPETDFPGVVTPGKHPLLASVVGVGSCQYTYEGIIKRRSDIPVLAKDEWDPALAGEFRATLGEGVVHVLSFGEPFLLTEKKIAGNKQVLIDVDYTVNIDASRIPGELILTVKKIRSRKSGPAFKQEDTKRCIYRSFQDQEGKERLWFSCRGYGDKTFPKAFDFPRRDYIQ